MMAFSQGHSYAKEVVGSIDIDACFAGRHFVRRDLADVLITSNGAEEVWDERPEQ
jgi:hypothetical protein